MIALFVAAWPLSSCALIMFARLLLAINLSSSLEGYFVALFFLNHFLSCCPICQLSNPLSNRLCISEEKGAIEHGQSWRVSNCRSCYCDGGEIICVDEICKAVACANPVIRKDTCCPICIDFTPPGNALLKELPISGALKIFDEG
jgi:hypothetical protein